MKPYVEDAMITIENYNVYRSDRSTRVGGGVFLYRHAKSPRQSCVLCVVYRPPGSSEMSFKSCLSFVSDY